MKKILLGTGALGAVLISASMFAAFEAHVINVTATIENALSVNTEPITFGTVFPQEQLDRTFDVALSQSFYNEGRVDDVEYIIRQKPKCAWTIEEGRQIIGETKSGHVDDQGNITCPESGPPPVEGAQWGPLPMLCDYLSKHERTPDLDAAGVDNDGSLAAFHHIGFVNASGTWVWNDTPGRLAKSEQDFSDTWNLDLKVPCFGGYCGQDWADFVHGINPSADPNQYTQSIDDEHKVFGCDVWVEVTGVSRFPQTP